MILNAQPVADQLAAFVRERFQISASDTNFSYDVHLWDQSYVDSVGILEILAFLEGQFAVRIPENALSCSPTPVRHRRTRALCRLPTRPKLGVAKIARVTEPATLPSTLLLRAAPHD